MVYCLTWVWDATDNGYSTYFHHIADKNITLFVTFQERTAIAWTITNYLFAQRDTENIYDILGILTY